MNIEDCEVGMKVERIWKDHKDVKKGSVYTIAKAHCDGVRLEGLGTYWYDLNLFEPVVMELKQSEDEPVNKFEIGDEVLFKEYGKQYKAEIFGLTTDKAGEVASIRFESDNEYHFRIILDIDFYLSPLKKKNELETGDKFVSGADKFEVLDGGYDEVRGEIRYFVKELHSGELLIATPNLIDEIIYD